MEAVLPMEMLLHLCHLQIPANQSHHPDHLQPDLDRQHMALGLSLGRPRPHQNPPAKNLVMITSLLLLVVQVSEGNVIRSFGALSDSHRQRAAGRLRVLFTTQMEKRIAQRLDQTTFWVMNSQLECSRLGLCGEKMLFRRMTTERGYGKKFAMLKKTTLCHLLTVWTSKSERFKTSRKGACVDCGRCRRDQIFPPQKLPCFVGLVHQKSQPQVPKKQCFSLYFMKDFGTCGGLFWGTNPSGN